MSSFEQDITAHEQAPDFSGAFDAILRTPLTVENSSTYADEAVDALAALLGTIAEYHRSNISEIEQGGAEGERAALAGVGLDPYLVERTLDRVDELLESSKAIQPLIAQRTIDIDTIIIPSDEPDPGKTIAPGDGSYKKAEIVGKLEALLLLLKESLDYAIEEEEAMQLYKGVVAKGSVRRTSYDMVLLPGLDRVVFSCDEMNNTTFVFDTKACNEYGISPDELSRLTKNELSAIIESDHRIGRNIDYRARYIEHLSAALTKPFDVVKDEIAHGEVSLMKPRNISEDIPPGHVTFKEFALHIAEEYGFDVSRVRTKLYKSLSSENIQYIKGDRGGRQRLVSPEEQVAMVEMFSQPDSYMTCQDFADMVGVDWSTVYKLLKDHADALGEVKYFFQKDGKEARALSPQQQDILLETLGLVYYANEKPPGYMNIDEVGELLGLSKAGVRGRMRMVQEELGEIVKYGKSRSYALSPEQVEILRVDAVSGVLDYVPEGYVTTPEVCKKLSISEQRLSSRLLPLIDDLGKVLRFRESVGRGAGVKMYSDEQFKKIAEMNERVQKRSHSNTSM